MIALGLAMVAYGRRLGKPWAGAAGALLTYACPVVGIDGTSAYNDVAVAAIVFSVFYWLEIWDESRDIRMLVPAGLLAGYAYAAKYTAFVILLYAIVFVAWRARKLRPLLLAAGLGCLMIAPWMVKNWIVVRNPIAPFGNQIFRNPNFHVLSEQQYAAYFRRYEVTDLRTLPLEVTLRGQKTQGIIGAAFLAAPMALAALRYRAGRRLLAAGTVLLATYFANIGTRFLIPSLPFFSMAMALALGNSTALLAALMIFHAASSWPAGLKRYAAPYAWRLDRIHFKEALRKVPQDRYLRENYAGYSAARLIDANVPKGERVLAFNGVPDAYTSREILVGYQGAFNETLTDILNTGWVENYQPRILQTFTFPEKNIRRIRVVQTAAAGPLEQWSVHELRFFDRGVELPRSPQWRLRAWPNPWEVQLAFDGSPATRWRTWERAGRGMYLDVDFGGSVAVDESRLETSYDARHMRVQMEIMDDSGHWDTIARDPAIGYIEPPGAIRHAATYEMQKRGIHYLLIHETDPGADDFHDDPEGWGLMEIAAGGGVRLYRVL
jgi:hypothetical protein